MSDANFASLSSSLLARKGGAKPAMRPQSGIQGPVDGKAAAANLEDLGWNDMGEDAPAPGGAPVAVMPAPRVVSIAPQKDAKDEPLVAAPNQVRESIDRIQAHIERPAPVAAQAAPAAPAMSKPVAAAAPAAVAQPAVAEPAVPAAAAVSPVRAAPAVRAPARRPSAAAAAMASRRAAFTLRLDHERHLQLRLACTVRGRSAQQLVTDALDSLLAEMPEIASLAAQVKRDTN